MTTNRTWKRRGIELAVLLAAVALGGVLVVVSGVIPIKASDGHWPTTEWFLQFSMQRSVSTHSLGIEAPSLEDPAIAVRGAGMYHTSCRPCHGDPALPNPPVAAAMTPHPPYLPHRVHEWTREELFYISKHGVLFTGMPAWPAQSRDDEVWALVAFLEAFPSLDEEGYREIVYGEAPPVERLDENGGAPEPPAIVTLRCARCHGIDGRGRGAFPALAGQSAEYLLASLEAYAEDARPSGAMEPIAADVRPEEAREAAEYYAGLAPAFVGSDSTEIVGADAEAELLASIARGREIAEQGIPSQKTPSCTDCHGETRDPSYPALDGQDANYLRVQLRLFRLRVRGGTEWAHLMHPVVDRLTDDQIYDVAAYYASLAER